MYICDNSKSGVVTEAIVYNVENALKGSKYPMSVSINSLNGDLTKTCSRLALSGKGEGHDNFLNGIVVSFDFNFTIKAWTEAERYHFLDFISSQSTMHRIAKFEIRQQYNEHVDSRIIAIMQELVDDYNAEPTEEKYLKILYSNPCGFRLTAKMITNYRQLKTIFFQRRFHKLPEWREVCEWIETLPYAKELIIGEQIEPQCSHLQKPLVFVENLKDKDQSKWRCPNCNKIILRDYLEKEEPDENN